MSSNGRHYPVKLDLQDVQFTREGPDVIICSSKPDQEGQRDKGSRSVRLRFKPCDPPLFRRFPGLTRDGRDYGRRYFPVKRAAHEAGLDPPRYTGHFLRAGLATSAAAVAGECNSTGKIVVRPVSKDDLWVSSRDPTTLSHASAIR